MEEKKDIILQFIKENNSNLEIKLDGISEKLNIIQVVQAEQAKDIKHHIFRTDILEGMIKPLYIKSKQNEGAIGLLKNVGKVFLALASCGVIIELVRIFIT